MIYYVVKWTKTLSLAVSSFASTSLSHCFSVLSAFLYSKPFRNNQKHCEITDRFFNIFFVEIQWKRKLEKCFWAPDLGHPNQCICLPNNLNTSLSIDKTLVGTEESTGSVIQRCSVNSFFEKLCKIHWKIPVLESLFNEVSDLETCNFIKNWLQQRCFPVNFAKLILRIIFCRISTNGSICPVDTGRKLNVQKTFRRRPGRLLNVVCTFKLRPVSTGWIG